MTRKLTLPQLAELLGVTVPADDSRGFSRVSGFAHADAESIVFAQDGAALEAALACSAGLILAATEQVSSDDLRVLRVTHPKLAFALCGQWFEQFAAARVHPKAIVEDGAVIGEATAIGAGAVIEAGARVGRHSRIGPNVTIHGCVTLGDRCVVQAGAVLGGMGFGYVRHHDGRHVRFPQIGTLVVEDDVEIGVNTTIDRGALGETRIGRGTKIDNLVHIAHNCHVGENVLMAAQVGMAGSCVIEDDAMLGGQVGLGERVTIGRGVVLGGQGGVLPGKRIDGEGVVYWGTPAQPVREYLRDLARLRKK